jgi:hypothetical protein
MILNAVENIRDIAGGLETCMTQKELMENILNKYL